jgi:S1-C subfamily serine protease
MHARHSLFLPVLFFAACAGGAVGGAIAGAWVVDAHLKQISIQGTKQTTSTTPITSDSQPVPLQLHPSSSAYPSFASRRLSPVLRLVKRGGAETRPLEDRLIGLERTVGYAVSVTTDGWAVAPASVFSSSRASDLVVVWNGTTYPIKKAVRDTATDLVYFTIEARDLPVVAFLHPGEVAVGSPAWIETRPQRFFPDMVVDVRTEPQSVAVSSERALRRFLVSYSGQESGGAVWDVEGRLIGLLETKTSSGWRVLPVGTVPAAVSALADQGVIRRSLLGVRSIPLASTDVESGRGILPKQGAWIVDVGVPASSALREGDVIERVERDVLDGRADLGERLLDYRPGTKLSLFGLRAGVPFQTLVTLGSTTTSEVLK